MTKILYISQCAPYDSVRHAGGQTLNYYIKNLTKCEKYKVDLLSFCKEDEEEFIDIDKYGIEKHLIVRTRSLIEKLGVIYSIPSKINPYNKYAGFSAYATHLLMNNLKHLKGTGNEYDAIFLEWTHIILHIDKIKSIYPNALIFGSEPDVSYLGYKRKADAESFIFKKVFKRKMFFNMKKRELTALGKCDYIYVQNEKDKKLLEDDGISSDRLGVMTPFYHQFKGIRNFSFKKKILFFGQMSRVENSDAVIWFIENVMNRIQDSDFVFTIIGTSPPEKLKKLVEKTKNVFLTGFVEDVAPYFYDSDIFVCPLLLGAGIKVKVLEAFYTGIPVLTNEIGIEGIPAQNGRDYLQCNTWKEYVDSILLLAADGEKRIELGENGKRIIDHYFNLSHSFEKYEEKLDTLLEKRKSQNEYFFTKPMEKSKKSY